jgi:hypothetical protein
LQQQSLCLINLFFVICDIAQRHWIFWTIQKTNCSIFPQFPLSPAFTMSLAPAANDTDDSYVIDDHAENDSKSAASDNRQTSHGRRHHTYDDDRVYRSSRRRRNHTTYDDDDDAYYYSSFDDYVDTSGVRHRVRHHRSNYDGASFTTSVTIRVTPGPANYLVSWSILFAGFVILGVVATYQVRREHYRVVEKADPSDANDSKSSSQRQRRGARGERTKSEAATAADNLDPKQRGRSSSTTAVASGRKLAPTTHSLSNTSMASTARTGDLESPARGNTMEESSPSSINSAEQTRGIFRKTLLAAIVSRAILMPIQIWSGPLWWQFFGDTFPEMLFASAWTILITFLVQLVGVATGRGGTDTTPGIVIQTTAYVVYSVLIITQIWNAIATVLLYALLCCIYAALFGTAIYFCPRLYWILKPTLVEPVDAGIRLRLVFCSITCLVVCIAHTVGYARIVVAPPRNVYWWWNYGALELFPSAMFLYLMHPRSRKVDRTMVFSPEPQHQNRPHEDKATAASRMPHSDSGASLTGFTTTASSSSRLPVTSGTAAAVTNSTVPNTATGTSESSSLLQQRPSNSGGTTYGVTMGRS